MENIVAWITEKKQLCVFILVSILTVLFATLYMLEVTAEETFTCPLTVTDEEVVENSIIIDIKGAVVNPGVYRVQDGTIIQDVIVLAGGLCNDADTSNLNLSKKVTNEMVITVFTVDEVLSLKDTKEPIVEEDLTLTPDETPNSLVSLNTATLEELMSLPGVGESKAKLILDYREKCGLFKSKEELKNIKGIGDAMYAKLEEFITV